jgi:hypothetical protein
LISSKKRVLEKRMEVEQIDKINLDRPFTKQDYPGNSIFKKYVLDEVKANWLHCSFVPEDHSRKCNTAHKEGYILELIGGERVTIGNVCLHNNFEQGELLRNDATLYDNATQRMIRVEKAKEILGSVEPILSLIEEVDKEIAEISDFWSTFIDTIGDQVYRILRESSGQSSLVVTLAYINPEWTYWHEYEMSNGKEPKKFVKENKIIGQIKNFRQISSVVALDSVSHVKQREKVKSILNGELSFTGKELEKIPKIVEALKQSATIIKNKRSLFEVFVESSFDRCSFLTRDKARKQAIIRWWHGLRGDEISNEKALKIYQIMEQKLLGVTGAHHIS